MAERIAGQHGHVNFNTIPWVIYTSPGDRLGRPDRAAAEGRRRAPTRPARSRSWPTAARARWATRPAWSSSSPTRRPTRSSACTSSARWRRELISEAVVAMEFRASSRRHRAHLPRAPVAVGSDEGSGAGGRQAHAELLSVARSGPASAASYLRHTQPMNVTSLRHRCRARLPVRRRRSCARSTALQRCDDEWADYKARRSQRAQASLINRPTSRAASTCAAASGAARAS